MHDTLLLQQPVKELGFSKKFCKQCHDSGFDTLETILVCPPVDLLKKKDFSYEWLAELTAFLSERGLLHLLQTIPGKSYG